MTELYLIAHKVRGEPAFDVASKIECAECSGRGSKLHEEGDDCIREGCVECDHLGFWWVIPTSGHRAYPYWHDELSICVRDWVDIKAFAMPTNLPDHYQAHAAPARNASAPPSGIAAMLREARARSAPKIDRRGF